MDNFNGVDGAFIPKPTPRDLWAIDQVLEYFCRDKPTWIVRNPQDPDERSTRDGKIRELLFEYGYQTDEIEPILAHYVAGCNVVAATYDGEEKQDYIRELREKAQANAKNVFSGPPARVVPGSDASSSIAAGPQ